MEENNEDAVWDTVYEPKDNLEPKPHSFTAAQDKPAAIADSTDTPKNKTQEPIKASSRPVKKLKTDHPKKEGKAPPAFFQFEANEMRALLAEQAFQPQEYGGNSNCERYAVIGGYIFSLFVAELATEKMGSVSPMFLVTEFNEANVHQIVEKYTTDHALMVVANILKLNQLLLPKGDSKPKKSKKMAYIFAMLVKAMVGTTYAKRGHDAARDVVRNIYQWMTEQDIPDPHTIVRGSGGSEFGVEMGDVVQPHAMHGSTQKKWDANVSHSMSNAKTSAKGVLDKWYKQRALALPEYQCEYVGGPAHAPIFVATCTFLLIRKKDSSSEAVDKDSGVRTMFEAIGEGKVQGEARTSKKLAMESAALAALKKIGISSDNLDAQMKLSEKDASTDEAKRAPGASEFRVKQTQSKQQSTKNIS